MDKNIERIMSIIGSDTSDFRKANTICQEFNISEDDKQEGEKIIFLDMDGVMNSFLDYEMKLYEKCVHPISPRAMKYLNSMIEQTGAKVVLSSVWRGHYDKPEEFNEEMKEHGFIGECIDFTPHSRNGIRGGEIHDWMKKYERNGNKIISYLILDDDSDMMLWQKDNFINVDNSVGLTSNNVYKGVWILNGRKT